MTKKFFAAILLQLAVSTAASAGLQEALATSINGLQAAETTISVSPPPLHVPEGAVFVDPIASTIGQAIFRSGPEFTYDPSTGSVNVLAPPMLGPADEFGQREWFRPVSLSVLAAEALGDSPGLPKVTGYSRNTPSLDASVWPPTVLPLDDQEPSFLISEDVSFSLRANSVRADATGDVIHEPLVVNGIGDFRSAFGGFQISLPGLLREGLGFDLLDPTDEFLFANGIRPFVADDRYDESSSVPSVQLVVEYSRVSNSLRIGDQPFRLLALPAGVAAPEPASLYSVLMMLIGAGFFVRAMRS